MTPLTRSSSPTSPKNCGLLSLAHHGANDAEIRDKLYSFCTWCADANIPEVTRSASTIEPWWPAVLVFLRTGITNARTEGYNRLIKQAKRAQRVPQYRKLTPPDTAIPLHPRPAGQHPIPLLTSARLTSKSRK
ncbi:transposase [Gordonia sp. DT30]|uniref:transposase n=1 Tax=Gordonia sp. DT30 TaxID=3416546 RepID=UPI003CF97D92